MKKFLIVLLLFAGVVAVGDAQEPQRIPRSVQLTQPGAVYMIGDDSYGQTRTVVTNAQILALLQVSVPLVTAPPAGYTTEVLGGLAVFNYTAVYTETGADDNLRLYYVDSGDDPASSVIETTGWLTNAGDAVIFFTGTPGDTVLTTAGALSNGAVVLSGVTGGTFNQLGGGNASNTVTFIVRWVRRPTLL